MRICAPLDIGKLKWHGTAFRLYLDTKRMYINKAQLGTDEGLFLGWIHKSHQAFVFQYGMKEKLQAMMVKELKEIKYALFPRHVKYKRSDGIMLTTNCITIQLAKTANTSASDFRAAMTDKWQGLTAKTGGTLWRKTSTPFGREWYTGDAVMTSFFQQQNKHLQEATQRNVQNVSDIDEVIKIEMNEEEDDEM
jgi:hypothetical protein